MSWSRNVRGGKLVFRFFSEKDYLYLLAAVVCIVLQVWCDIRLPEYMEVITDSFLSSRSDVVGRYGIEMLLFASASVALSLCAAYLIANMSASVGRNIRRAQFDRALSFSKSDINRFSVASLITRSTNDVYQIQNMIARATQFIIKAPILAVWSVSKIMGMHPGWLAIVVSGVSALMILAFATIRLSTPFFRRIQGYTDGVNRITRESLDGIRPIRAYNAESFEQERFGEANGRLVENNIAVSKIMAFVFPVSSSMQNFLILAIYWAGAGFILGAGMEDRAELFTDMIVITSYSAMAISAFMMVFGLFRMLPRAMVGYSRITEVVDTESSLADGSADEGETDDGSVRFDGVSFTYPGSAAPALEDISFEITPGSTFAVVGPTGSGKSTLVNLVARFYDVDSGTVYVDGRDVREYRIHALHGKMGYVPQTAVTFSGSVEENVNYGSGSDARTTEDVRRALEIAQAGFVYDMPDGLDSNMAQYGRNVSGGQKQRLGIARAVCRDPEIYIFDDSFSALDFATDRKLRDALRSETEGSTVIIVAQRIGTVMDADRILVLDGGRAVGLGTHDELMRTCPLYKDIADSQFNGGDAHVRRRRRRGIQGRPAASGRRWRTLPGT